MKTRILLLAVVAVMLGCGGVAQRYRLPEDNNPVHPLPTPTPVSMTADQVFDVSMSGQVWKFEGTCGGDVIDAHGNFMAHYDTQTFHLAVTLTGNAGDVALTYLKDVPCGYWGLGIPSAQLYDFNLARDTNGGWYNTSGHIVMPFGCPWCVPVDAPVDVTYTVPPPADPTLPRPYLIVPPYGDNQQRIKVITQYGTTSWETDSYVEYVTTPVYTGNALVSEQWENGCVHEKWDFAPGLGLVRVISTPVTGCSGLQTPVTMVRVQ